VDSWGIVGSKLWNSNHGGIQGLSSRAGRIDGRQREVVGHDCCTTFRHNNKTCFRQLPASQQPDQLRNSQLLQMLTALRISSCIDNCMESPSHSPRQGVPRLAARNSTRSNLVVESPPEFSRSSLSSLFRVGATMETTY
jgi:hypothetical protein